MRIYKTFCYRSLDWVIVSLTEVHEIVRKFGKKRTEKGLSWLQKVYSVACKFGKLFVNSGNCL